MIIEYNKKTPDVSKAAFIAENATIIGDVVLEEGVSIWYGAVLRGDSGPIRVGRNSNIQDNCVVHCDHGGKTQIGDNVLIGHNAIIHGCTIEDGCMIGMGSILMNDAWIGANSLVGAGALVTERKSFPEQSLILGNPARVLRPVTKEQIQMMKEGIEEYLRFAQNYASLQH